MKKALLPLVFVFLFISSSHADLKAQACTPDGTFTLPGIWPDSIQGLDTAFQCLPYSQVLTVIVPVDTVVGGVDLWVDSIVLTGIGGLPAGLSYVCEPPSCGFVGGTTGCVLISGTPLSAGVYGLDAYTTSHVTMKNFPFLALTQVDTITYYNIVVDTTLLLAANVTNASCVGVCDASAMVTPTGGTAPYTYLWNDPANQTTQTAAGLCAGVYGVTVTAASGCFAVDIVTITNSSVLTTNVVTTAASCGMPNGTATATTIGGTANYVYSWSSGDSTSVASGLAGGTYIVNVTDAAGCTDLSSGTVSTIASMSLTNTSTFSSCGNTDGSVTVSVTNGTPPYNGWGAGVTDTIITPLASGTYVITITDAIGCVDSIITNVSDLGGPTVTQSAITMASCNGVCDGDVTVTVAGASGPLTYLWDDPAAQTNAMASGLCAGTHIVTVNDTVCTAFLSVMITEPAAIVIGTETVENPSCNGAGDDVITIVASGGTGSLTYSIDGGTTFVGSGIFSGPGAGAYSVMVMDSTGCTASGSTLMIIDPLLVAIDSVVVMNISCNGLTDASVVIFANGGTGALDYSIDGGANYGSTTGFYTGLSAITIVPAVRDSNLCQMVESPIIITEPTLLAASVSATMETGAGNADGTAGVVTSGGTSPYTYSWNSSPVQTNATATGLTTGDYVLDLTDANGCQTTDTVNVGLGVGIDDIANNLTVELYPNPAQNELNMEINLTYDFTLIVYDLRGKQVLLENMKGGKNSLSIANLTDGLYVYHLINNSGAALFHGKFNVLK